MKRVSLCFFVCLVLLLCGAGAVFADYTDSEVNFYPVDPNGVSDEEYQEWKESVTNMPDPDEQLAPSETCYEVPGNIPTREGYRFVGWKPTAEKETTDWSICVGDLLMQFNECIAGEGYVGEKLDIRIPVEKLYDGHRFCGCFPQFIFYPDDSTGDLVNDSYWKNEPVSSYSYPGGHTFSNEYFTGEYYDSLPDGVPDSIILGPRGENSIVILYLTHGCLVSPNEAAALTVRCVNAADESELPYGEVMEDLEIGTEMTVEAPAVEGFIPVGDTRQTVIVSANAEENVVTFRYEPSGASRAKAKSAAPDQIGFFALTD